MAQKPVGKQAKLLCIRIDTQCNKMLENMARENNMTLSDLVRELIEFGLSAVKDPQLRVLVLLQKSKDPLYRHCRKF